VIKSVYCVSIDELRWGRFCRSLPGDWPFPEVERCSEPTEFELPSYYKYTRGSYGCLLGHVKIWRQFLEKQEDFVLVFEDDAKPLEGLADRWKSIEEEVKDLDCKWLYLGWQRFGVPPRLVTENIAVPFSPLARTHAYVLRRDTVEMLLEEWENWGTAFDMLLATYQMEEGSGVFCVMPQLFDVRRLEPSTTS